MSSPPKIPGPYFRTQENASSKPLGDHAGETAYPWSVIFCTLLPSASIMYICGSPVRPLTQAIWPLVFGLKTGDRSPLPVLKRRALAPDASATKISDNPLCMEDEKAILVPSDDQAGEKLSPGKRGKATVRPRSMEYIMICQDSFVSPLNASREPSGEILGDSASDPSLVTCF